MEIPKVFSSKNIWLMSIVFVVILSAFLLLPRYEANAADPGEYVWFRIDTELDVLNAKDTNNKVTVRWYCTGATSFGQVTDNTASESTNVLDGIIKVASNSKEMTDASCTIGASETLRASVSLDGWVEREWTVSAFMGASTSVEFTQRASMDYNFVVGLVKNELGSTLTLNGTTASASYSGTTASASYSGGYKYVAATADGTLTGGANGYVNKTVAVTWSSAYGTTSKSADFNDAITSTYNGDQLPYGVKVTLNQTSWRGVTTNNISGATVVAGTSSTSCTDNSDGKYYCAVPVVAGTSGTTATATLATFIDSNTCTYTDRTSNSSVQSTCTITAVQPITVTEGGGSGLVQLPAETTPTPTPTPTVPAEATPTPTPSPGVSGTVNLYRKAGDPKVYVQGSDGTLTWVKTIEEFNTAGYKWSNVKVISGSEFAQMKVSEGAAPVSATLFRKANDPKVYVQGSDGTLTWVKTIEAFNAAGYGWANVRVISGEEFGKMRVGGNVRVVKGITYLRVRSGPSTANKVIGQVLPGQELKFTEVKNGWYRIDSGWVSGAYAKEF